MARQVEPAESDLGYFADLRAARDVAPGEMPADLAADSAEQAADLRRDFARAPHDGLEMAGPYVQSFYGDGYAPDASLPRWLGNATDDHVLHFQRMHTEVRGGLQRSAAVLDTFQEEQRHFLGGIRRGMKEGWISDGRFNSHVTNIEDARLRIGGVSGTYLAGQEAFLSTGRTFATGRSVVIAPGIGRTPQERVLDIQNRIRRTLPRTLASVYGRGAPAWARTGFAEHLGTAVEYGNPLVIDPAERGERSPYAAEQRALLAALVRPGGPELACLFTLAMTSTDTNSGEWVRFRDALDKIWNVKDTFDAVSSHVSAQQAALRAAYPENVPVEHEQFAAQATLETLQRDPAEILGRRARAHPVGMLALTGGSRHYSR